MTFNASRAPGPSGVFVSSVHFPRFTVFRWPGRPANDNDTRSARPDLDDYYRRVFLGQVKR